MSSTGRGPVEPGTETEPPILDDGLAKAFAALDRGSIRWCLLRGEADLDRADLEVDLLVDARDAKRLASTLAELGFMRLAGWGRGSHAAFVAYNAERDTWTKLDFVSRIDFGPHAEIETGTATACLSRRSAIGAVQMLASEDRFWALLLHCILDRAGVAERHAGALQRLAGGAVDGGPLAEWFEAHAPQGWDGPRVVHEVRAANWGALAAIGRALLNAERRRSPAVNARRLRRGALRRLTKLRTAALEPGLSIALLGPDGAGKSTMAAELGRRFYFPVRSVYMGLYGAGPSGRVPRGSVGRIARQWIGYARATYHRRRGRLVVYDRFAYDALLQSPRRPTIRSRLRRWVLGHAVPAPDVTVLLDAPPEVLRGRKDEHDLATLRSQRHAYLALAQRLDVPVVRADREPDVVRREVTELVWRRYMARRQRRAGREP